MAICIIPEFAIFLLSSFHIFKFFIISIFLRYTDIHNCSKFPFLLPHLEFSQDRKSVRTCRMTAKPIAARQNN